MATAKLPVVNLHNTQIFFGGFTGEKNKQDFRCDVTYRATPNGCCFRMNGGSVRRLEGSNPAA